jgi:aspartyl-tRNA(Asn)/glutamyl-tRNA(Gln) amidotransferase subunit A
MDCVGPLTRSVRDAALMLSIIAGRDASDSTSSSLPVPEYSAVLQKGVAGLRIGVVRELNNNLAPEVRRLFERALKQLNDLGAHVDEVSIPSIELGALINAVVTYVEALEYHQPWLAERGGLYGDACRLQLETGLLMSATNYVRAQKGRARVLAQTLRAMEKFDVIVAPGVATVATSVKDQARIEQKDSGDQGYNDMLRFTQPFDATGQPVLALPTGLTADGLPASIQIIARPFDEALLFQVGAALERARGPLEPPAL